MRQQPKHNVLRRFSVPHGKNGWSVDVTLTTTGVHLRVSDSTCLSVSRKTFAKIVAGVLK